MPYALGASGASPRIWIESDAGAQPHRHEIAVRLGAGEQVEIEHEVTPLRREVRGPRSGYGCQGRTANSCALCPRLLGELSLLVRGYHLFNPHAKVSFSCAGRR